MSQVFISYRQTGDLQRQRVRSLGEGLRGCGIDVVLDQFFLDAHPAGPNEGWDKWSSDRALHTEFVLIVGTDEWFQCFEKKQPPGTGLGAACEADDLRHRIYEAGGVIEKIRVVLLDDADAVHIPAKLSRYHRFHAERDFANIVRWLSATVSSDTPNTDSTPGPAAARQLPSVQLLSEHEDELRKADDTFGTEGRISGAPVDAPSSTAKTSHVASDPPSRSIPSKAKKAAALVVVTCAFLFVFAGLYFLNRGSRGPASPSEAAGKPSRGATNPSEAAGKPRPPLSHPEPPNRHVWKSQAQVLAEDVRPYSRHDDRYVPGARIFGKASFQGPGITIPFGVDFDRKWAPIPIVGPDGHSIPSNPELALNDFESIMVSADVGWKCRLTPESVPGGGVQFGAGIEAVGDRADLKAYFRPTLSHLTWIPKDETLRADTMRHWMNQLSQGFPPGYAEAAAAAILCQVTLLQDAAVKSATSKDLREFFVSGPDKDFMLAVALAIAKLDASGAAEFLQSVATTHESVFRRADAAKVLSELEPIDVELVQCFEKVMSDKQARVRQSIVHGLAAQGRFLEFRDKDATQKLFDLLAGVIQRDDDEICRAIAATVVQKLVDHDDDLRSAATGLAAHALKRQGITVFEKNMLDGVLRHLQSRQ